MDKNLTIPPELVRQLKLWWYFKRGEDVAFVKYTADNAEQLMKRPEYDPTKKLMVYISGVTDNIDLPVYHFLGKAYLRRGYNVLLVDTIYFTNAYFPISASVTRDVGRKTAAALARMHAEGLDPRNVELVGLSMGGVAVAFVGKAFYEYTGKKLGRISGLDPSGVCRRRVPAHNRLDRGDALFVQVLHTNEPFGSTVPMGHQDFFVNGGEWQPLAYPDMPCFVFCSHIRAYFIHILAMDYQEGFVGVRCDSVQSAKDGRCRGDGETAVYGLAANTSLEGIFYLPTGGKYPYYLGKKGLRRFFNVTASSTHA